MNRILLIPSLSFRTLMAACALALGLAAAPSAQADTLTVAAAADLKFALDEIVTGFEKAHPGDTVNVVYGSSGQFQAQIQQGAPYDLFFSADIAFPRALAKAGFAASKVVPYALGRIVLWSPTLDARSMTLQSLTDPRIKHIAIANPRHAPYGQRAEEALRAAGLWDALQPRLVFGENIAQTAQFVQTGNAQIGVIALSLAKSPQLARLGGYALIPESMHQPLEQGYIITRRAADSALARRFVQTVDSPAARQVLARYGFEPPKSPDVAKAAQDALAR
ncbi:molybdate ABC transporter substrate-binding protein [Amphibiibacter pelophylacis]|uniref:Molybdate ABC transporter substrate-binding protein n=1 Tax=Amphibiibacter pelophylacis TaxID=1799477 RepID=A0ACC6P2L0_9BURK